MPSLDADGSRSVRLASYGATIRQFVISIFLAATITCFEGLIVGHLFTAGVFTIVINRPAGSGFQKIEVDWDGGVLHCTYSWSFSPILGSVYLTDSENRKFRMDMFVKKSTLQEKVWHVLIPVLKIKASTQMYGNSLTDSFGTKDVGIVVGIPVVVVSALGIAVIGWIRYRRLLKRWYGYGFQVANEPSET